ncbi:xylulokinase [Saccharopolyspora kobensis]|uniref:Xylulose kinase n=3 Tax=Saccharopolyspora kobensis TaxID=146035 RepID=A0A1H6D151_9PSEU|nr:xylulokinase [Saccharopolyspora kobensis]SEG78917.1 xylulokinase [Saccharopolyspora kobensis]SFD06672.1 xylulokinase [Saccharopolyspora kobensis]
MSLVAGVDSSTQSTKVVVCDSETGQVVREGRAPHPDGTVADPAEWWHALTTATAGLLDDVAGIGIAAQQHGLVALNERGEVVRPALLWNDNRSAQAAADLTAELGGARATAAAIGSVPVASFTVSKLRWMAEHEPELADRVTDVLLPHDWLTWRLTGEVVTDRGDASGTGYWSPGEGRYREDVLATAFGGRTPRTPRVLGPAEPAGRTPDGKLVSAGTGDNMGAALGLAIGPGDVVVSLGTSGTVFASAEHPSADPTGTIAGFADATGRFLPLVCTLNAARVLTSTAALLGVEMAEFDRLACEAAPGADDLVLLPYLDGERTPTLPDASGTLLGLRRDNMTPQNLARAAVEGMLCGLATGVDALREQGVEVRRVLLIGGAAQSEAVQVAAPQVFGVPVTVPAPAEYVARGAARQAAWALTGQQPDWHLAGATELEATDSSAGERIRHHHREAFTQVHGG